MCFGGGGGSGSAPAINVIPQNPYIRAPKPPEPIREVFRPLQSSDTEAGVRMAGTTKRRKQSNLSRRQSLSSGLGLAQGQNFGPSGGINL